MARKNRLDEETLMVVAAFGLALKAMAKEVAEPTGTMQGQPVEELVRVALMLADQQLHAKPERQRVAELRELAECLGVEFIRTVNRRA